jgi:predicted transcriptional regulator
MKLDATSLHGSGSTATEEVCREKTASIREVARIIGVDHTAVSRAFKAGEHLRHSVINEGDRKRIIIFDGWLE